MACDATRHDVRRRRAKIELAATHRERLCPSDRGRCVKRVYNYRKYIHAHTRMRLPYVIRWPSSIGSRRLRINYASAQSRNFSRRLSRVSRLASRCTRWHFRPTVQRAACAGSSATACVFVCVCVVPNLSAVSKYMHTLAHTHSRTNNRRSFVGERAC